MPVIGVTGSVATGKTAACRLLATGLEAKVFDADEAVRNLLETDEVVRGEIVSLLGPDVLDSTGALDRRRIRDRVFSEDEDRRGLERILHPRVRRRWEQFVGDQNESADRWFLLEIPLLYETQSDRSMDRVVVTACSRRTQLTRLRADRGVPESVADGIMRAQDSQESKIARADHLLWNDGSMRNLGEQVRFLVSHLNQING